MEVCWLLKEFGGSCGDCVCLADFVPVNLISWLPIDWWELGVCELVESSEAVGTVPSRGWPSVARAGGWRDHALLGGGGAVV